MTFTCFAVDPATGEATADLTRARNKKARWRLDLPCDADFTLDGNPVEGPDLTSQVDSLTKDLLILYNGSSTFGMRCRVGASEWDIGDEHVENWNAVDYRGILQRRYARSSLSFESAPRGEIIEALLAHTRTGPNPGFPVTPGDIGEFSAADLSVAVGKSLGQQIDELAGIYPGFDVEVDANLQLHARTRGQLRDFVLEKGVTVDHIKRNDDPTVRGNSLIQTGADGTDPAIEDAPDMDLRPEGRWEIVASNPDLATPSAVNGSARQGLLRAAASGVSHTFTLTPGIWTPDQLWIGDLVRYRYVSAGRSVDAVERVYEIAVEDDPDSDVPKIEIKVGNRLTADLAVQQRRIVMTLNQLARR